MNSQQIDKATESKQGHHRRNIRPVGSLRARAMVSVMGFLLGVAGCSEAETPNAQFVPAISDGGTANIGGRDQLCDNGRCNETDLICVEQNSTLTCRLQCELDDTSDPCGNASLCRRLDNNSGACFPGGLLDEACINSICDDGLSCTLLTIPDPNNPDGGTLDAELCKQSCSIGTDGGAIPCPPGMTCALFTGSSSNGVCL